MGIDARRLGPDAQRQVMEQLLPKAAKPSKYHNKKTPRVMGNGSVYTFDSEKEAKRYDALLLMLHAGEIRNLKLQHEFVLIPAYTTTDGERIRATRYLADFSYERRCGQGNSAYWKPVVEDVKSKGTKTDVYQIKRKLMQERFEIGIEEV